MLPQLSIAFDLPNVPPALALFRQCVRRAGSLRETLLDQSELLVRIEVQVPQQASVYRALVECLATIDEWSLQTWSFPPLYTSGIFYETEPAGQEVWQSTPALYARGSGDCEDLAAHRTAEHRFAGTRSSVHMDRTGRAPFGGRLYHFTVRLPDGSFEDPSRALGME